MSFFNHHAFVQMAASNSWSYVSSSACSVVKGPKSVYGKPGVRVDLAPQQQTREGQPPTHLPSCDQLVAQVLLTLSRIMVTSPVQPSDPPPSRGSGAAGLKHKLAQSTRASCPARRPDHRPSRTCSSVHADGCGGRLRPTRGKSPVCGCRRCDNKRVSSKVIADGKPLRWASAVAWSHLLGGSRGPQG